MYQVSINTCNVSTCRIYILPQLLVYLNLETNILFEVYILWAGSVVGIATVYGPDGPGIESRWGRDFPHLSRPALGPSLLPVQSAPGLSGG